MVSGFSAESEAVSITNCSSLSPLTCLGVAVNKPMNINPVWINIDFCCSVLNGENRAMKRTYSFACQTQNFFLFCKLLL